MSANKYRPEYCEKIVQLGQQGYGVNTFAAEFNCSVQTLYIWKKEHDEFKDAFNQAVRESRSYLERHVIDNMTNKSLQVKAADWCAKFMHQISEGRKLRCGIKHEMSFLEQSRCVNAAAEVGHISVDEAAKLSVAIANAAKVEENDHLKNELREIKELIKERGIEL